MFRWITKGYAAFLRVRASFGIGRPKERMVMAGSVYDGLSKSDLLKIQNSPQAKAFRQRLREL
ncbi:MAG TPA: hypothetical protein VLA04_05330 [Verrucomicrobiae bacterium]|nr:hypothetical protein [Verrucomicrobiae bacterium]